MAGKTTELPSHPHVLIRGKHQAWDSQTGERRLFQKGEVVLLTSAQAHAFRDKFKALEVIEAESKVQAAQADAAARLASTMKSSAPAEKAGTPDQVDNSGADAASGTESKAAASTPSSATAAPQSVASQSQKSPANAAKG